MPPTRALWLGPWLMLCIYACAKSSPSTPTPVGYDGAWSGTTADGTSVAFTVSHDSVSAFTLAFNHSLSCVGTETIPGPVAIVRQTPPGPPPFDQPGFAMSKNGGSWGIAASGAFSADRQAVTGEFVMVDYPNCGTFVLEWSAKRR